MSPLLMMLMNVGDDVADDGDDGVGGGVLVMLIESMKRINDE